MILLAAGPLTSTWVMKPDPAIVMVVWLAGGIKVLVTSGVAGWMVDEQEKQRGSKMVLERDSGCWIEFVQRFF